MAEPRVPVSGRRTLLAGAGTIVACTHQGYIVTSVSGGTINCPCHGSKFSITNGSVVTGPAASALAPVSIKVQGTSIVQA